MGPQAIAAESCFAPAMWRCPDQFEKVLEAGIKFSAIPRRDPRNGDPRTDAECEYTARQLWEMSNKVLSLKHLAPKAARAAMYPNAFVGDRSLHSNLHKNYKPPRAPS